MAVTYPSFKARADASAKPSHDASSTAAHDAWQPRRPGARHHPRAFPRRRYRAVPCPDPSPEPDCCRTW